jgi:AcrR family transcriptional regulator
MPHLAASLDITERSYYFRIMSKGEQTREAILERAIALASVVGLEALSIGKLAAATGLSKSGLFAHFGSKEALQIQVLDAAVARFVDTVFTPALKEPRGEPRLRALFENWLTWERSDFLPGGCLFVATAAELDDRPGPVRDHLVLAQRDWLEAIANAVRLAVTEGHFRPDTDPDQVAYEIHCTILGYWHTGRLLRDPRALERARTSFEGLLDRHRTTGRDRVTPTRSKPKARRRAAAGA